jgi:hypothetical protein
MTEIPSIFIALLKPSCGTVVEPRRFGRDHGRGCHGKIGVGSCESGVGRAEYRLSKGQAAYPRTKLGHGARQVGAQSER